MDSDKEAKRRKSIAYILRRRKRGRRIGANSGKVVKSWAEYSEVNFTPSGAHANGWRRAIWLVVLPLAVLAPFVVIASSGNAHRLAEANTPLFAWVIFALLGLVLAGVAVFASAFTLISAWRALRRLFGYKNE